jgi:heme O synthase-like polyprenyltransferase
MWLVFMALAVKVWSDETDRGPKRMFAFSILYLFLLFGGLIVDGTIARIA